MHQRQYPLYHRDNHTMSTHSYTSEYELAQMAALFSSLVYPFTYPRISSAKKLSRLSTIQPCSGCHISSNSISLPHFGHNRGSIPKLFEAAISCHTTTGTKDVKVRVETSTSPGCLKHNSTTNIHWFLKPMADNILEESMASLHKLTQERRIMIETFPELLSSLTSTTCRYLTPRKRASLI